MTIPFMKSDEELQDYVASFPPYLDPMEYEEKSLPPSPFTLDELIAHNKNIEDRNRKVKITRPKHYSSYAIEPIEYINKNKLGYNEGNIVKYVSRHRLKNKAEDIRKAIQYCEFILRYEYGEEK
tara:strand:+ start:1702 stop:2073 length:372 start_codon:yes stop_codon:yes gene_type:complete